MDGAFSFFPLIFSSFWWSYLSKPLSLSISQICGGTKHTQEIFSQSFWPQSIHKDRIALHETICQVLFWVIDAKLSAGQKRGIKHACGRLKTLLRNNLFCSLGEVGGKVVKSCSPFSAAKWQRQKSRRSRDGRKTGIAFRNWLRYNFYQYRQIVKERIEGGANEKAALIFR